MTGQLADIVDEARRLLDLADDGEVLMRLLGGVAIEIRRGDAEPLLPRVYKDLDFVTVSDQSKAVRSLFEDAGYEPDAAFNAMNGRTRLLFFDTVNDRQVDVFIDEFSMCHRVPVVEGLAATSATVPLTQLLTTKLQIFELNEKDQRDILNLLHDHPLGLGDAAIDPRRLGQWCADDWGLWRTVKLNLERSGAAVNDYELSASARSVIAERLDELWRGVDAVPKSKRWKLRNRIGDRVRWYELPDEVS